MRQMRQICLQADDVRKAIMKWPGLYEDETGNQFLGMPVSQVPSQLIQCGWRNVSHLDQYDFKALGLEIRTARYVGGVHKKRFCEVVVGPIMSWYCHQCHVEVYQLRCPHCGKTRRESK